MWVALGAAGSGAAIALPNGTVFTPALLTAMGIGLFFGAVGKSAQFPLHVWLPDAMEGPTPVSALIHAATMVAAGVYLVGRIFPILTPDAKLFIAIIGATTLTMAALIALVQSDIKKVLAYSTLSQLGYMILAMGIGSWVGGLFHLITHAFFKALLFLGSGSVIHAAHHEQELPEYGGLIRRIPVTGVTFGIAVLAIAGTPFFSGFYSKDMILSHAAAFGLLAQEHHHAKYYWLFFILPTCIAYVTAFYMTRCWMLTFWGKPRNQHLHDHAHESPIMYVPLVVLAVLSVIGGSWLGVREMLEKSIRESNNLCSAMVAESPFYRNQNGGHFGGFARAWPAEPAASGAGKPESRAEVSIAGAELAAGHRLLEEGEHVMKRYVGYAFLIGIGAGFLMYMNGYSVARRIVAVPGVGLIHTWLYRRMYFDELYLWVFVKTTRGLSYLSARFDSVFVDGIVNGVGRLVRQSAVLAGLHDQYVVDGSVNGMGQLAQNLGSAVRAPQTGRIRMYATVLIAAVAVGLAGAIIFVLSR
jgi:NADH-quinone oxidoreductase subunit L